MSMMIYEKIGLLEEQQREDEWDEWLRVEPELTFTLNLMDQVEDETRRIGSRLMRQVKEGRTEN